MGFVAGGEASADTIDGHSMQTRLLSRGSENLSQQNVHLPSSEVGTLKVTTTKSGAHTYIHVQIRNKRVPTTCWVTGTGKSPYGDGPTSQQTSDTKRDVLDARGNADLKFGPFVDGPASVGGGCFGEWKGENVTTYLANPYAVPIAIGGGPAGSPAPAPDSPAPGPSPSSPAIPESCSDGIQAIMDQWGLTGQVEDQIQSLVTRRGIETTFQQACALLELAQPENWTQNPNDIVQNFCRVGKSLIPAELAYRALEEAGRATRNQFLKDFGGGAARSWAQQCEW